MSDKQKAIVSLTLVSETCTSVLTALRSPATHPSSESPPLLTSLHGDLLGILSLHSHNITKLAIALKPSEPAYLAVLTPASDLTKHLDALGSCALMFNEDVHGATLKKQVIDLVGDIVENTRGLIETYLHFCEPSSAARSSRASGDGQEEYLQRTGTIHAIIDKARSPFPNGLSRTNAEAVKRKWEENHGSVADGLKEVGQMIEEAEADDNEDFEDDGWDELGLGEMGGKSMSKEEVERVKKVHPLLKLTTALHKRILTSLSSPSFPNKTLDTLPPLSTSFLTSSDDLIATLYVPQDPSSIDPAIKALIAHVKDLEGIWNYGSPDIEELEDRLEKLELNDAPDDERRAKDKRWYEMCFKQIYKVADDITGG